MSDSGNSFDFGNAFEPEKRPRDTGAAAASQPPTARRLPEASEPSRTIHRASGRRGQSLAWTALVLTVVAALAIGFGLFLALDSLRFSLGHALSDSQAWLTMSAFGLCGAVLAFALSVFGTVTARPKRVAAVALVLSFVLPPMALILGVTAGFSSVREHAEDASADISRQAMRTLASIDANGLSPESIAELITLIQEGG